MLMGTSSLPPPPPTRLRLVHASSATSRAPFRSGVQTRPYVSLVVIPTVACSLVRMQPPTQPPSGTWLRTPNGLSCSMFRLGIAVFGNSSGARRSVTDIGRWGRWGRWGERKSKIRSFDASVIEANQCTCCATRSTPTPTAHSFMTKRQRWH